MISSIANVIVLSTVCDLGVFSDAYLSILMYVQPKKLKIELSSLCTTNSLDAFYTIEPENVFGLFYSFWGLHGTNNGKNSFIK